MPQLTLRDLFAVVTIVALALGWWVDRQRLAKACHQMTQHQFKCASDLGYLLYRLDRIFPGFRHNPEGGLSELETWKMERTVEDPLAEP